MVELKRQILVIDDEAAVRKLLRRCFESESYKVLEAENRQQAIEAIDHGKIDLITLDINLDGEDGLSLAREIRTSSVVPIIMVSGKGDLIDKVVGLEVGADDYISKPFELREVLARVRSAIRRSEFHQTAPGNSVAAQNTAGSKMQFQFDNCRLCPSTRDLSKLDGTSCELTSAEFDLLHTLVTHPQQVLSRDKIMDSMKGQEWNPCDRTIDNQIARLRKKLDSLGVEKAIKTVRGMGYQFTPAIQVINNLE